MFLYLLQEKLPLLRSVCSSLFVFFAKLQRPRLFVQFLIRFMIRKYKVDLSEFEVPKSGFINYREFHARSFKKNAREINFAARLVFPSDGLVLESGRVHQGTLTQVKGVKYKLDELLNASGFRIDPKEFEGSSFLNLFLPIESYHRWHSPIDGHLVQSKYIRGIFLPLTIQTIYTTEKIYARNERLIQRIRSDEDDVLIVAVGGIAAVNVFSPYPVADKQNIPVVKGQEMGGFYLGSSIVLIAKGTSSFLSLKPNQKVRLGEALVR